MRQHHAFGPAGGAGGVDQCREIARCRRMWRRRLGGVCEDIGEFAHDGFGSWRSRAGTDVADPHAFERWEFRTKRPERLPARLGIEKNQTGLGMAEDVGVACCAIVRVKPDDNQARRMRSHVETHPIDSVGQQNRHAVSGLEFLPCECSAEPVNARGNRVPGVIAPILGDRIVVSVSNGVRAAPDTLAEQPPQRTRLDEQRLCRHRRQRTAGVARSSHCPSQPQLVSQGQQSDRWTV